MGHATLGRLQGQERAPGLQGLSEGGGDVERLGDAAGCQVTLGTVMLSGGPPGVVIVVAPGRTRSGTADMLRMSAGRSESGSETLRTLPMTLSAADGVQLAVRRWLPERGDTPKGIVQIAHGMAEHSQRYGDFAGHVVAAGYAVYANDHRGHGESAASLQEAGHFADRDGWVKAVQDLALVTGSPGRSSPAFRRCCSVTAWAQSSPVPMPSGPAATSTG